MSQIINSEIIKDKNLDMKYHEQKIIEKLESYYYEQGILPTSFTCKYQESCRNGREDFTEAKSSFVGPDYVSRNLPRLLILSLDSGSGYKNTEKRMPRSIQAEEMKTKVMKLPKNRHWYLTHKLAHIILQQFDNKLQIEDAKRFFAHVNSAKCSQNKKGNRQASSRLFENCRGYIPGELELLEPDIVLTQGKMAKIAFKYSVTNIIEKIDNVSSIVEINSNPVFWIHTYHPTAYGYFYKQVQFNKDHTQVNGLSPYWNKMKIFLRKK